MATDSDYELFKNLNAILSNQVKKASETQVITCLEMYIKLLANIDEHPDDAKFQRIKKSSKLVSHAIGGVPGGYDLLLKVGWVVKVQEFEEWFVWTGTLQRIAVALKWARESLVSVKERSAKASASSAAAEKEEEQHLQNLLHSVDMERKERYQKEQDKK